jgi:hypothetical protein
MRGLVVVALGCALVSVGCKKTVEGENKAWERNLQRVGELSVLYPGFANALAEQKKKAEEAMTAAKAAGGDEAPKKMAEANALLDGGFVGMLGNIDARTKSLREKAITASTEADHGGDQAGARAAADDAQRILRNTDDALKAGAADAATAQVVLRKIDGDLSSATANVDRVIDSAKRRKAEAAKATAPAAAAPGATAAAVPAAPIKWKCTYCNALNDDAKNKCTNCGAPRMAAKTTPAKPAPGAKKK